ncbi:MaoC family dehydratase [Rhizobium sp. RCC_161_2]|uniref:MaoC family dehydratase n=1 Tax=Rhizobium sp. RCC_161_2 TaxID=3239219 RepID=UPI0035262822
MNVFSAKEVETDISLPLYVGQSFCREVSFSAESIKQFARLAGDTNPLHHDSEAARVSRFGKLIAAGTQSSTLLAGAVAANLCNLRPSLGLQFSFKFRRAVLADEPLVATWEITEIKHDNRLGGDIITISCALRNEDGALLVHGEIVSLVSDADEHARGGVR